MATKVMIVDDDKDFLTEISETLVLVGYEVSAVNDPTQVVEKALRENPNVMLLDLKMPKINGFSLAAEMRHYPELANLPIIAVTGYFKEDYLPLMNICGIHNYLKKPFNVLDAITQIEAARKELKKR
ncbi:MAG: response regulator [Deltaproteobacteria bacterium]